MAQFSEEAIQTAAGSLRADASVESVDPVTLGQNTTYRVDYDDRETILKIGTESPERVRAEPAIIDRVAARTTVPLPTVVATGEEVLSTPYALFERVPGKTADDLAPELSAETLERVWAEAGAYLGDLHAATEFDGVGPLVAHESGVKPETVASEWDSLLDQTAKAKIEQLGEPFDAHREALAEGIERMLAEWTPPSRVDPVLAHMDYRPANLVLSPDAEQVTEAVIDWGGASAVPAGYKLAHVEALVTGFPHTAHSETFWRRFRAGYCEARDVETVPRVPTVYRVDARLRLGKHLELIADTRTDTSLDTLVEEHLDRFRELGALD